jgi:hypothetical protein
MVMQSLPKIAAESVLIDFANRATTRAMTVLGGGRYL